MLPLRRVLRFRERRDRVDDLSCGHNGTRVVRDIHVESSVHFFIRVIRSRVFYHRDLVAKFSGITNSCLHTGVCYESDDDELMDAVLFELQIQIGVGKATGTPMLRGDNVAWLRLEPGTDLPGTKDWRRPKAFSLSSNGT